MSRQRNSCLTVSTPLHRLHPCDRGAMEERFDCKSRACSVCLVKAIFDLPRATGGGFRGIENTDRGTWGPDSQKRLMFSVRKTWKSAFLAVFIWKLQSSWLVTLPGTSHWRWYNFPESRESPIFNSIRIQFHESGGYIPCLVYSCLFHRCPMFPWFVAVVCLTPQNIPAVVALGESINLLVVRSTRDRPGRKNGASGKFKRIYIVYLVGGISTPLKNMKVSWDDYSQYMENQKCSKPPTRYNMYNIHIYTQLTDPKFLTDRSQNWQI